MGFGDQLVQLEGGSDERAHIVHVHQLLQEWQECHELLVAPVIIPALNGDAIAQLEAKSLQSQAFESRPR